MIRIIVTVGLMAVIFGYPPFAEGTDGPCGALVAMVADHVMSEHGGVSPTAQAMINALGRPMGYKVMADRYRQVPVQVTCTYMYLAGEGRPELHDRNHAGN